jgi:D-hydroxyproline dehydrogenase subunit alpha
MAWMTNSGGRLFIMHEAAVDIASDARSGSAIEHGTVPVSFEGRVITARLGESLAACLAGAGILAFRETKSGAERGLFCGMGVCQDCLVEVEGQGNLRACMVKVEGPLDVRRGRFARPVTEPDLASPPITIDAIPVLRPDVLVVGAGPAGLSAALAARSAGAEVLLLDERRTSGG